MIRDINLQEMSKALSCRKLQTGTWLNQEQSLQIPGGTRWSSDYKSPKSLVDMFPTIVKVLEIVEKDKKIGKSEIKHQTFYCTSSLLTLSFICISC